MTGLLTLLKLIAAWMAFCAMFLAWVIVRKSK